MSPRTRRWLPLAAGIGLMALFFLPTGEIETPWPPYTLKAWAYMEPMVWPFLPMGLLLAAAPWSSGAYRRRLPMAGMLLGGTSIMLFLITQLAGRKAIYGEWFPDQLGPANLLEFHLLLLILHFAVAIALAFSGLVLLARRWQRDHLGLESAMENALSPVPISKPGSAQDASADLPPVPSSGLSPPGSSNGPSSPDSSPAPSSPVTSPASPSPGTSPASSSSPSPAQPSAPPKSDLPSFLFTSPSASDSASTSKPEPETPEEAENPAPPEPEAPPAPKPA